MNARRQSEILIKRMELRYLQCMEEFPHSDPHQILAVLWIAAKKEAGHPLTDASMLGSAFSSTMPFACLPPEYAIEALALCLILQDHEWMVRLLPELRERYHGLLDPIMDTEKGFNMGAMYKLRNPHMARVFKACWDVEEKEAKGKQETEATCEEESSSSEGEDC